MLENFRENFLNRTCFYCIIVSWDSSCCAREKFLAEAWFRNIVKVEFFTKAANPVCCFPGMFWNALNAASFTVAVSIGLETMTQSTLSSGPSFVTRGLG